MRSIVLLTSSVVIALALLVLIPTAVLACDISIKTSSTTGYVGEQKNIVVQVKLTHRNCLTPIDETIIQATGATILAQSPWRAADSQTYEKTLTIRLDREGEATIKVIRECSKGGDVSQTTIDVLPAGSSSAQTPSGPVQPPSTSTDGAAQREPGQDTPTAPASSDATVADDGGEQSANQTTAEQKPANATTAKPGLLAAVLEPRTLALIGLTLLAIAGFLTGNHRLRVVTLFASLGYLGFVTGGCLCPLGAFQKLFTGLEASSQRIVAYVTLAIPIVTTLLFGRLYCGWICPSGALQELLHRRNLSLSVPQNVDRWLRQVKYFLLIGLVWAVRITGEPIFEGMDPFKAAFNLSGETLSVTALIIILAASLFLYRPWCRYLCPMGALLGLISRISFLRLSVTEKCVSCRSCARSCSAQVMEAKPTPQPTLAIDEYDCLRCGDCRQSCRKAAISISARVRLTAKLSKVVVSPLAALWRVWIP